MGGSTISGSGSEEHGAGSARSYGIYRCQRGRREGGGYLDFLADLGDPLEGDRLFPLLIL